MSQTRIREAPAHDQPPAAPGLGSSVGPLLGAAAGLHLAAAAGFWDVEAAVLTAVYGGTWLLLRSGRAPRVVLVACVVLFGNTLVWSAPAAWVNVGGAAGILGTLLPLALTAVAVLGLVAATTSLLSRPLPMRLPVVAAAIVVLGGTAAGALGGSSGTPPSAHGEIVSQNTLFSPEELEVVEGEVTLVLGNRDFFWHTVTIPDLDVRIAAPMQGSATGTFTAAPGTYRFVCEIPGHEGAGMVGTLTVHPAEP